ncbi:MAG: sulfite exporter TauE/SafE family protein [Bacteroidales bacterium]|nr:sulfite exporter TauE/SafE family protein [Bacteroidales bacterium]
MSIEHVIILVVIGLLAGFVSGSMGVGGGIIIIPALVFFLGLSQQQAQGTSIAVLSVPVAIAGAINYYKSGYINFKFAGIIILTFVVGTYFGSLLAVNLPAKTLQKMFGVLLLLVGIKMILGK